MAIYLFLLITLTLLCLITLKKEVNDCLLGDQCEDCRKFENCVKCTNTECLECLPGYLIRPVPTLKELKIKKCFYFKESRMFD